MTAPSIQRILYFCDETSHMGDEFMAVGGIAINMNTIDEIETKITDIRTRLSLRSEIKWSNIKARRDNGHLAYAELLKELIQSNHVHFHIRFQRVQDWDHRRSGPRRKIDTVSHAYYQLTLHRPIALYGASSDIHLRPDNGECTERLHQYMGHLNTEARKHPECKRSCVRSIHTVDSKKSHPHQLLDVTLGAFAAIRNNRHIREDISQTKHDLAMNVHRMWDNIDLSISSAKAERKLNVWNVIPKK